jgi:hypothetical protein
MAKFLPKDEEDLEFCHSESVQARATRQWMEKGAEEAEGRAIRRSYIPPTKEQDQSLPPEI